MARNRIMRNKCAVFPLDLHGTLDSEVPGMRRYSPDRDNSGDTVCRISLAYSSSRLHSLNDLMVFASCACNFDSDYDSRAFREY